MFNELRSSYFYPRYSVTKLPGMFVFLKVSDQYSHTLFEPASICDCSVLPQLHSPP